MEWRKNPQWSFSCCLALIVPLVGLPGDISGFESSNAIDNQLEIGEMEISTTSDADQDDTLGERKQNNGDLKEAQGDGSTLSVRSRAEDKRTSAADQGSGAINVQVGENKQGGDNDGNNGYHVVDKLNDEKEGKSPIATSLRCRSNKCHQGTQTVFARLWSISQ